MNDYKPYKQLKQKQKAKVVERMYKELHQFFSDNQRFPDTPDEHELLARQIFSHIPYHVSFDEFYAVYVTHSGEGEGLLFFGNIILPFVDRFPTDLELYRIMTTKLGEVSEGAQK